MDFYVSLGKTKAGPYSIETMKEKGYWTPDVLVRSENGTEWKRVADLSESEWMDAPVPEEKAEKRRPDFPEAITIHEERALFLAFPILMLAYWFQGKAEKCYRRGEYDLMESYVEKVHVCKVVAIAWICLLVMGMAIYYKMNHLA